jgi:hypothetical protein
MAAPPVGERKARFRAGVGNRATGGCERATRPKGVRVIGQGVGVQGVGGAGGGGGGAG